MLCNPNFDSTLYHTVGLCCAGKSTYCNTWAKEKPMRAIICPDDFRAVIHEGEPFISSAEKIIWCHAQYAAQSLLHRGYDVILDATLTTQNQRDDIRMWHPVVEPVVIHAPLEGCIKRANNNGKEDVVEMIKMMCDRWDYDNYYDKDKKKVSQRYL